MKHDGGYQVSKTVRDLCVFARQNVAKDPPFSKLDMVSCRNLLIYMEPALQKRIIPMYHYALKPQGFLLLGTSESIGSFSDMFELVDKRHQIYAKRPTIHSQRFDFEPGVQPSPRARHGPRNPSCGGAGCSRPAKGGRPDGAGQLWAAGGSGQR